LKPIATRLARAVFVASLILSATVAVAEENVEGLPPEAPREGTIITIDVSTNHAYLFEDGALIQKSRAATGSDTVLKKGFRFWLFRTPRGKHVVQRKVVDPIWTKPDWAFVEEGKPVPPPNSPSRKIRGKLGKYALDLGEGIMIHGTDDPKSIGKRVSHGCIRLPNDMLKTVYRAADVGTAVYIFDSGKGEQSKTAEYHSDLDYLRE
jgi:lipoprotein-anchoring transpeptidase ErfK/SrfK